MGIISIVLVIASGIAGVTLTVWGRVVPPETQRTKRGFVAVGCFSVVCIIAAGILNAISQSRLNVTIVSMADDVRTLAEPAKVNHALSADQILAAAASKLIQQQNTINQLDSELKDVQQKQKEQNSPKKKIRDLLYAIDSRIPSLIDSGQMRLVARLQPQDTAALQSLANDNEGSKLLHILAIGPVVIGNTINDGSLGTTASVPQQNVAFVALPALQQQQGFAP